jgi:GR25 family glycosyltransferase involved in LPS biosynthesis
MKVYVIHYKKLVERKANILRQFDRFGITDYEFIDIDRSEIDNYEITKYFDRNHLVPAQIAITLSHIEAYKRIVDNNYEEALILEDDAIMSDDFGEIFQRYLNELSIEPYYDMLFLGDGCNLHMPVHKQIKGKHIYHKCIESSYWGGDGATKCVDSYLVSNSCAKKICEYVADIERKPIIVGTIDHWLNYVIKCYDMVIFWAEPTIVTQSSMKEEADERSYESHM